MVSFIFIVLQCDQMKPETCGDHSVTKQYRIFSKVAQWSELQVWPSVAFNFQCDQTARDICNQNDQRESNGDQKLRQVAQFENLGASSLYQNDCF